MLGLGDHTPVRISDGRIIFERDGTSAGQAGTCNCLSSHVLFLLNPLGAEEKEADGDSRTSQEKICIFQTHKRTEAFAETRKR